MTWWRQNAAEYQMRVTVEAISEADWCSGDRNTAGTTGAREGRRRGARTVRSRVVAGGIGIMGRIQMMPRWTDDPVHRQVGSRGVGEGEGCPPPRKEIMKREER